MAHIFIAFIEIGSDSTTARYMGREREESQYREVARSGDIEKRREKERQLSSRDTERLYYIQVRV